MVTGTGIGEYWKFLAMNLHTGGFDLMVVVCWDQKQQHTSAAAIATKQPFSGVTLLPPKGEGTRKGVPK
jgi:hypothetical protein